MIDDLMNLINESILALYVNKEHYFSVLYIFIIIQ